MVLVKHIDGGDLIQGLREMEPDDPIDYYVDTVGATTWLATGQIDLYLCYVGVFTAYKTGMLKILELREHAQDELGDDFDIRDFHRTVLLHNRLPLPLL